MDVEHDINLELIAAAAEGDAGNYKGERKFAWLLK